MFYELCFYARTPAKMQYFTGETIGKCHKEYKRLAAIYPDHFGAEIRRYTARFGNIGVIETILCDGQRINGEVDFFGYYAKLQKKK